MVKAKVSRIDGARVTFGPRQDPTTGTWKVTTRRGAQVVHHDKLTKAQADSIEADPDGAHREAWARPVRSYR